MKVLVASESRHGSTTEIAAAIAEVLESEGHQVEQRRMVDVETVFPYDAYVLGSAVYRGSWERAARRFLDEHAELLATRPTWLFSSGPVGHPAHDATSDVFGAEELVELVDARDHQLFGGKLDSAQLGLRERAVTRLLRVPDGDYRAWESVVAWATAISRTLADSRQEPVARS